MLVTLTALLTAQLGTVAFLSFLDQGLAITGTPHPSLLGLSLVTRSIIVIIDGTATHIPLHVARYSSIRKAAGG